MTSLQTTAVMVFGGLLAAVGVALLVFTRTSGANRIRAFGVEFELSTPVLVVFLAGCALIVAPFVVGSRESGGDGGAPETSTVGQDRVTCDGGARYALTVLKSTVADGVRTVPVRLQNLTDKVVYTYGAQLTIADAASDQLEPLKLEWSPPIQLAATNAYRGSLQIRTDSGRPLDEITVRATPLGCPPLAARARL